MVAHGNHMSETAEGLVAARYPAQMLCPDANLLCHPESTQYRVHESGGPILKHRRVISVDFESEYHCMRQSECAVSFA